MKALLKSGDTDKIAFFANVSRQKELFIMAANYFQSLDWRQNPKNLKRIIEFYTKGKAPDLLDEAVRLCEALLEEPELDPAVRIGDAFGFLVEHHCQQGQLQMAYQKLEELQKLLPSQSIRCYISQASLDTLQREMGIPLENGDHKPVPREEDEVEEDLTV
ncbi:hypothetical protein GOODEAATRI_006476 [Goodea atripinnis]|uniref:IF140/IFT172/WDR19 TPR domain-containing protein n=1 Tax=Goodea atripinnis TaxID=208336 RepID=A0ABV0MGM4_9TELE